MKQNNKIAVIGGTGKSGKYLVKQLLEQGYEIKLLLRNPRNFQLKSPLIEVIEGNARNYPDVRLLLDGCNIIISTLGQPKGEPTIFSQATKNIVKAMGDCGMKRYILITGLNVDTPFDKKGPKTKFATEWMKTNYKETTLDKQMEYDVLSASNIDWTLVRLPLIDLTDEARKVEISQEDCLGDKISATDLAHFLIRQMADTAYVRKSPFIWSI
jgi:putative NADH-flavin reductase